MPPKKTSAAGTSCWNQDIHGRAISKKFDDREWDPLNQDTNFIIAKFKSTSGKSSVRVNLMQFLSAKNGGAVGNQSNSKAIDSYCHTASEWFVGLGLSGVQKCE